MHPRRVAIIVLDSVGVGALPDAAAFGDEGSNTLRHVLQATQLELPNLVALGLHRLEPLAGPEGGPILGSWGRMAERSAAKDTTTGHWELMGLVSHRAPPTYPDGFPSEIIAALKQATGRGVLGNRPASGTAILEELGAEHLRTGDLIVYTSADSVLQIAAHEDLVPVAELYRCCELARRIMTGEHAVLRIIARPFVGQPGSFRRTERRRDFSLPPPQATALDHLQAAGVATYGVGKIGDIFAGQGLTKTIHTGSNADGIHVTLELLRTLPYGLIFTNLVDFDTLYGHRNNPHGYAQALREFDLALPHLRSALRERDLLLLTADHGCDPTTDSTDHSREYVPLLVTGAARSGVNLGTRETFADLGATICELFEVPRPANGRSFWAALAP